MDRTQYIRHRNGGGLKHRLAKIGAKVFIEEGSRVEAYTKIGKGVCIKKGSVVHRSAVIGDKSYIGKDSVISMHVLIGKKVRIDNNCHIGWNTRISDNSRIYDNTFLENSCIVEKNVRILKDCRIHALVCIRGDTIIHGNCVLNRLCSIGKNVRLLREVEIGSSCVIHENISISRGFSIQRGFDVGYIHGGYWQTHYMGFRDGMHWVRIGCKVLPINKMLRHLRTKDYTGTTPIKYLDSTRCAVRLIKSQIKAREEDHGNHTK